MIRNYAWATIVLAACGFSVHAASPFDGTWKADLDKNTQNAPPEVHVLIDGMFKCLTCQPPYEIRADGSDQPASSSGLDARSVRIVDTHSIEITGKKGGQRVFQLRMSTSHDGNTEMLRETVYTGRKPFTVTEYFARVAAGPPRSHAISGTWKLVKTEGSDDVDLTTFKVIGKAMSRRDAQGSSYLAQLDGTPAPYAGDPRWDHVSVRMPNQNTLEETMTKDGRVRMHARWSIDSDGTTMHARFETPDGKVFNQSGHKVK